MKRFLIEFSVDRDKQPRKLLLDTESIQAAARQALESVGANDFSSANMLTIVIRELGDDPIIVAAWKAFRCLEAYGAKLDAARRDPFVEEAYELLLDALDSTKKK